MKVKEKRHIIGLNEEILKDIILTELKEKPYRVKQIIDWIYKKGINSFFEMSNLPLELRKKLEQNFRLNVFSSVSIQQSKLDSTTRYNFVSIDNNLIPAVYIPEYNRNVVCISTQIGCPVECIFCNSGKTKFLRNLTVSEIVGQVLEIKKSVGNINSILFMGMGEPLLNYENVVESIKIFLSQNMFGIGRKKITVSTIGVVPNIYKLAEEQVGVQIAVSLHFCTNEERKKYIKNIKFSVEEILNAAVYYSYVTKTKLTIEYVLMKNINDSITYARQLVTLLAKYVKNKNVLKINLIPYNPIGDNKLSVPSMIDVEKFKEYIRNNGFLVFIRQPHGIDINSACGQLGY